MDNEIIFLNTKEQCKKIQELMKAQTEKNNRVLAILYGDTEE